MRAIGERAYAARPLAVTALRDAAPATPARTHRRQARRL
jgi:hypothetical protein